MLSSDNRPKIHIVDRKQVAIITANEHTYNVRFVKSGKFMEIKKEYVKTFIPKNKPKKEKKQSQTLIQFKMEIKEYLDMLGFDTEKYTILGPTLAKPLLSISGHQTFVYPVADKTGQDAFGKEAKIVNINWYNSKKDAGLIPNSEQKEEVPPIPEAPKKAEEVPPVPVISSDVVKNLAGPQIVDESEEEELPPFAKVRIGNMIGKGWKDNGNGSLSFGDKTLTYKEIADLENSDYTPLLLLQKEAEQKVEEVVQETKKSFTCKQEQDTGECCPEQCKFCKQADQNNVTLDEQKEIAEKKNAEIMAEQSSTVKEEVKVEEKTEEKPVKAEPKKEEKQENPKTESSKKSVPKKEEVKIPSPKVYPAPNIEQIEFIEKMMHALAAAKTSHFIIVQIAGVVKDESLKPEEIIARIKELTSDY